MEICCIYGERKRSWVEVHQDKVLFLILNGFMKEQVLWATKEWSCINESCFSINRMISIAWWLFRCYSSLVAYFSLFTVEWVSCLCWCVFIVLQDISGFRGASELFFVCLFLFVCLFIVSLSFARILSPASDQSPEDEKERKNNTSSSLQQQRTNTNKSI